MQGLRWLKNRSLLFVNDCFEDKRNAAIVVFLQALLTNENIPLASVNILMKEGFDVIAVGHDFLGFLDHEVMELAIEQKRTIITFDRDYGELIFKKGYRPEAGVIYLRWKTFRPEDPGLFLVDFFRTTNIHFENRLTVISEESVRQKSYDV